MLSLVRAVLKGISGIADAYRSFVAVGRPDEAIAGKLTQHFGFRSIPTSGTELITLQFGHNNFSVAENDGPNGRVINLSEGDVAIYRPSTDGSSPSGFLVFSTDNTGPIIDMESHGAIVLDAADSIYINGKNNITIYASGIGSSIILGNGNTEYSLLTENFITEHYLNHTHPSSGAPLVEGVTPGVMKPDVLPHQTVTTKAN